MSILEEQKNLMNVLTKLDAGRCDPAVETQRRFRRYSIRGEARLEALDERGGDESVLVQLRDISYGGLGFLISRFVEPNTNWRIRFILHDRVFASQSLSIRFCRMIDTGFYLVGAQYIIEPFVLSLLGVAEERLRGDDLNGGDRRNLDDFVAPDAAH